MNPRVFLTASALLLVVAGCRDDAVIPTELGPHDATLNLSTGTGLSFRQISAGGAHTCGVSTDDQAYCWGRNEVGQLGVGISAGPETCDLLACSTRPLAVLGGLHFRHVSAGATHTCGVTLTNQVYCWGDNSSGQLGIGNNTGPETCDLGQSCSRRPLAVAATQHFRQVASGQFHSCAVNPYDRVFCWGSNFAGQLGDGSLTDRLSPVRVKATGLLFRRVTAGAYHNCALSTDSATYCWGANGSGQLGDRTKTDRPTPVPIYGGHIFRNLDAGDRYTCGVSTEERAYCWGEARFGQLGDGTTWPRRLKPIAVLSALSFSRVTGGGIHTCGETTTNRAYCWGTNYYGALGDGTETTRLSPVAVAGGLLFAQVSAGADFFTCAITPRSRTYCWGHNQWGQLGDGTTEARLAPTLIAGPM